MSSKIVPALPSVRRPTAPYSPAVEAAGLIFISGQVANDPSQGTPADTSDQARIVMENIGAILRDVGLGYPNIVKTTIFLTDISDFAAVNEVYASFFENDLPARSTLQVGALPRADLKVEIEAIAVR